VSSGITTEWPSPDDISSLPPNHRRAIAGVLRTLERRLSELHADGLAVLPEGELKALGGLVAATGSRLPERSPAGLLAALAVLADGLEPDRLAGYGPLSAVQRSTLSHLAIRARNLLTTTALSPPAIEDTGLESVVLIPIGVVHSPFDDHQGTPIQPRTAEDHTGYVELLPEYAPALADLEGFDRIWIVSVLDRGRGWRPLVIPYRDTAQRGLFATRAPSRPNPVGISAVRLLGISGCRLDIGELDLLDGTPVLDIKPYVPEFDAYPEAVAGWLDRSSVDRTAADNRFAQSSPPESDDAQET